MARLWIRDPTGEIREEPLEVVDGEVTALVIGRDHEADIVLNDQAVSRRHARLFLDAEGWHIADLGSSNQTFVNGDPVKDAVLAPGDRIGIGDCELHLIGEVVSVADDSARTQVLTRLGTPTSAGEERAARVLSGLYQLSRQLTTQAGQEDILDQAIRLLTEEFAADRVAALLLEGDTLLCRAAHSRKGQALRGFVLSQTIYHEVVQSREAVLSRDTREDTRFREQASVVGEEIRSVIAAPIRDGDRIQGILYVDRLENGGSAFQSEDLYGVAVAAEMLGAALTAQTEVAGLSQERETLVKTLIDTHPIVGNSPEIDKVRERIRKAAPVHSTVLILGETGTGKELVARAIHYHSPRRGAPFVEINCAAIPITLVESELFGHEKGAFTGAVKRKPGKFELADSGTVFLDEIAELPFECQSKLLRLLEERCFERVGGTQRIDIDVRIVAASNRDLSREVEEGRFRDDLFYRLNVLPIHVPSLRERSGDVELLLDYFLDMFSQQVGVPRKSLSRQARARLLKHSWPGNVRQLRNTIESCVVMSSGDVIEVDDLPQQLGPRAGGAGAEAWEPCAIEVVERVHIARVLEHVNWNKSQAAELLGIERSTLYARIKNYGLQRKNEKKT